ncbi:MlaD family protein [Nocardia sp. NBC_01503]|uniref:MlaD family protein n=1 Tax=Nocardia sp. NBC_01503 TaxID=2975997 RepID=UPI002E7BC78C|nr:MlaD family protein [Nocardia sp. NBC_01503]WTL32142.1 MlaD family protein [Nocardia sp. NBC_01503]
MRTTRHLIVVVLTTAVTATLAACSANPAKLPMPSDLARNGYPLTIEFANALNLPAGAKVSFDGAAVGSVRNIDLTGDNVAVGVDIRIGIVIPADSTAAITQDTVLGDAYVKIQRPQPVSNSAALAPNSRIAREHTVSPAPLEDTLAVLANFLGSGSVQRIEQAIGKLNAALPPTTDDVRKVAATMAVDVRSLAAGTADIDRMLTGVDDITQTLNRHSDALESIFSPHAMKLWANLRLLIGNIGILLPSVGSVYTGGNWLVPMIDSLAVTVEDVSSTGTGLADTGMSLQRFLRTTLLPLLSKPAVDVTSLVSADGNEQLAAVEDLLRMLGAVR